MLSFGYFHLTDSGLIVRNFYSLFKVFPTIWTNVYFMFNLSFYHDYLQGIDFCLPVHFYGMFKRQIQMTFFHHFFFSSDISYLHNLNSFWTMSFAISRHYLIYVYIFPRFFVHDPDSWISIHTWFCSHQCEVKTLTVSFSSNHIVYYSQ